MLLFYVDPSSQTDIERSAEDGISMDITFQAGETADNSITISFNLTDDEIGLEDIEEFIVRLEILTPGLPVAVGEQDTTVVNVVDNDSKERK